MSRELNKILLIDDDRATNFLHQHIISTMDSDIEVLVATDGQEGIAVLTELLNKGVSLPDLILLDINMPVMDGFQFLQAYNDQMKKELESIVLVMLTTSLLDTDRSKANSYSCVKDFVHKPLSKGKYEEIKKKYFS